MARTLTTIASLDADGLHELVSEMRLVPLGESAEPPISVAGRATIGSSELATLRIDDRAVSRLHCEVTVAHRQARIRDLNSRNGTFVDGVAVIEAILHDGVIVRVGGRELRFEIGSEHRRVQLSKAERFGALAGRSAAMRQVFAQLDQAAQTDATILLHGETGTGKELAAEAIRDASPRRDGPFVIVDCGATPANLLESELFGHEKGAFTSANQARAGAFEAADGGTVFLDEIGELPLELQPKLLRVLSKREVKRVGRNDYRPIDVRVIAATNRDLVEEVERKSFRADLYYRLAVVEVRLPPLRERLDDLDLLVGAIADDLGVTAEARARLLGRDSIQRLAQYRWPGNVRELRNVVERSAMSGGVPVLAARAAAPAARAEASAPAVDPAQPLRTARDVWTAHFERQYLGALLEAHGGNVRAAAAAAGIDRVYLYRLLWKHELRRPS